jgi:hypothetical protein
MSNEDMSALIIDATRFIDGRRAFVSRNVVFTSGRTVGAVWAFKLSSNTTSLRCRRGTSRRRTHCVKRSAVIPPQCARSPVRVDPAGVMR